MSQPEAAKGLFVGDMQASNEERADRGGFPLLEVDNLTVSFGRVKAVEEVSLVVRAGEACAVVGESGCGKSTLAYALLGLVPPPGRVTSGEVRYKGRSLGRMRADELQRLRGSAIAMVFQAAMSEFNPVITIGRQVEHILEAHPQAFSSKREGREYFEHLLELVRLDPSRVWGAFESRLSGGMKQRVAIAVALLLKPAILVLDEPTTALDVLSQRLVLEILADLHGSLGVTIVFVTHDLAVVSELATRVAVMYAGRLVELSTTDEVFFGTRRHPYVAALISAIPSVVADAASVRPIPGQVPNLADLPPGCRFAPRCSLARSVCYDSEPVLISGLGGHAVACHVVNDLAGEKL